jgi:hypothetical protein
MGSGVWPEVSSHGPQRNQGSSLLKCDCWLITAGTPIRNEPPIRGRGDLPWIHASVWVLRNTSQYGDYDHERHYSDHAGANTRISVSNPGRGRCTRIPSVYVF